MDIIYNDYYCLGADKSKEGGFARIIKVKHKDLEYVRALKVLNAHVFSKGDKVYKTFLKECKTLLKIGNGCHPNIVRIYQPRLVNQSAVVEMDYVNGETLEEYLERVKFMPIGEVYKFIHQIGGALAYCHVDIYLDQMDWEKDNLQPDPKDARRPLIDEAKRQELIEIYHVVHNDLHSANVMRRYYDGDFILLDFGLAIQNGACVKSSSRRDGATEYKSPEKWESLNVETPQNDIYSFGVLLYKALTGQEPFPLDKIERETMPEKAINDVREMHLHKAPPAIGPKREAAFKAAHPGQPWRRDYPDWLETMVMKCLEKDPQKRYSNAKELVNEFRRHLAEDRSARASQAESERIQVLKAEIERLKQRCDELSSQLREAGIAPVLPLSTPRGQAPDNGRDTTHQNDRGVNQADSELVKRYRRAADMGNPNAQNKLGVCYQNGKGVVRDYAEAAKWYRKSAEQGQAFAQFNLGCCYEYGKGVNQDYAEAVKWYRKSAEQGNSYGQNNLCWCYEHGLGVNQDYTEAVKWYRKSAEQGNASAQNNLGVCYHFGKGVSKDYTEAVKWYRKSAAQGNSGGQSNLGNCYEYGKGVSKDLTEAVKWYRKAAEQGHVSAKIALNRLGV